MSWVNRDEYISTTIVHTGSQSLYHDGTVATTDSDHPILTSTDVVLSSDFTIEFFAYAQGSGLTSPVTVVNGGDGNGNYIVWWQSGVTIYLQWYNSSGRVVWKSFSVGSNMNDRWVHIAMSYISATDTVYFACDGIVNSYTDGLRTDFSNGTQYDISFMIWAPAFIHRTYTGYVDDFRITHEALYTAAYTVPDPSSWAVGGTTIIYESMEPIIYFVLYPTIGSVSANLVWDADPDALFYQLRYTDSVGLTTVAITGTQELETRVENLSPESVYTIELLSSATGGEYTLLLTEDITTLENTAANFDTSTYENTDGDVDISELDSTTNALVSPILNELFTTSDTVVVSDSSGEIYDSTFLNLNGTVNVGDSSAILIPFDSSRGTGQSGTIVTTNGDSVVISFDDTTGQITVDGVVYSIGDSFILDGKRILISG